MPILAALSFLLLAQQGLTRVVTPPLRAHPLQAVLQPPEMSAAGLVGHVLVYTDLFQVAILWRFERAGKPDSAWQRVPLDFWPTAVTVSGESLIVAGTRPTTGRTLIQRWSFPSFPEIASIAPPPPRGAPSYLPKIATEDLYDEDVAGQRGVRLMTFHHGTPGELGAVLVLFQDSSDLYSFDLASRKWTLVLDAASQPDLASSCWDSIRAGEHAAQGYVYQLVDYYIEEDCAVAVADHPLVLLDHGKDGTIDFARRLTLEELDARLGKPATWTSVFEHE